uniref:Putative secreted salivary protease inhibitor n=1 Tax=Ixodes scapularis TaxID=6945 RepID=Q4PME0_IXOSC|nr:putative secreted salivary protease inhibitor [Ixodes scapularis]
MKVLLLTFALMILVAASEGRRWPGMPGPGPSKAMFRRYKCVEGRCLEYIYGGCGPDGGGYRTMDQCERFCHGFRPSFPGRPRYPEERRHCCKLEYQ